MTIRFLNREIVGQFDLPDVVVSNNGPACTSVALKISQEEKGKKQ